MSKTIASRYVSRTGLAEVFGVSAPTVDHWVRTGCPFVKKGGKGAEWQFDIAAVAKWRAEQAVASASGGKSSNEDELNRRKLEALTIKAELDLAKAKAEVAPIRDFERAQAKLMAEIRANVMNLAQRTVTQLIGETDETRFKEVMRKECALALEAAANAELTLEEEDEEE